MTSTEPILPKSLLSSTRCPTPKPQHYSDSTITAHTQQALHSPFSSSLRNSSLRHFVKHLNHTRTSSLSSCFVLLLQQPCLLCFSFPLLLPQPLFEAAPSLWLPSLCYLPKIWPIVEHQHQLLFSKLGSLTSVTCLTNFSLSPWAPLQPLLPASNSMPTVHFSFLVAHQKK
jgi:hypothetical protein